MSIYPGFRIPGAQAYPEGTVCATQGKKIETEPRTG